jgi:hypothetical protein
VLDKAISAMAGKTCAIDLTPFPIKINTTHWDNTSHSWAGDSQCLFF